jgi:hypothetical protein
MTDVAVVKIKGMCARAPTSKDRFCVTAAAIRSTSSGKSLPAS